MDTSQHSASAAIEQYYASVNRQDAAAVADFLAEDCVYEDLYIFTEPMRGRQEMMKFVHKMFQTICAPDRLQFVIDGITKNDPSCVGVLWHMECKGKVFPLSRGCSFYRVEKRNGKLQLIFGRDMLEPPVKPGESGLDATKGALDKFQLQ